MIITDILHPKASTCENSIKKKKKKNFFAPIFFFLFFVGEEPSTFREVVDAYSVYLSQRGVKWDLSYLYPGLVMRIGPTLNGAGVLEFLMEKRLDYVDRAKLGPGKSKYGG